MYDGISSATKAGFHVSLLLAWNDGFAVCAAKPQCVIPTDVGIQTFDGRVFGKSGFPLSRE